MKIAVLILLIWSQNSIADKTDSEMTSQILCTGYKRVYSANQLLEEKVDLKINAENENYVRMDGEIGDIAFGFSGDRINNSYMISITEGPDYTHGILSRGAFDKDNYMQISNVKGSVVYKLECTEK